MGRHPEVTAQVATLLKRQKRKCAHCGLMFKHGDLLEIDHITPKSKGRKQTYDNKQLLHLHCHDTKTANDLAEGRLDKSQVTEEPDEGKLSCPVLKTSRDGDIPA